MTQEEQKLLMIDLCARLPYEVKIKYLPDDRLDGIVLPYLYNGITTLQKGAISYRAHIRNIRPFLRPMSSMTAEEVEEYNDLVIALSDYHYPPEQSVDEISDWLNSHHFDHHGLIIKGLALVAPEGMYKTE